MKALLRALKGFWFLLLAFWLLSLLSSWFLLEHQGQPEHSLWVTMSLVTAFCLLCILLRQYRRLQTERGLEHLLQLEIERSAGSQSELHDRQVLRERLRHAIALLRTRRKAEGEGRCVLHELPWYLVLGMPACGKTSLLAQAGFSASVVGAGAGAKNGETPHCDWYFSAESVLIDSAGRYLVDDRCAGEFAHFLKLLRQQRRKPAINGLLLVVSLPDLLQNSAQERQRLAQRLRTRIEQYSTCLGNTPPIYLMLSKADLLPGFTQTFSTLDAAARQQVLGITFALAEAQHAGGLRKALDSGLCRLLANLHRHIDGQLLEQGAAVEPQVLNFPGYFSELADVLGSFLGYFEQALPGRAAPVLRGLYFTSALQTGQGLPPLLDDAIGERFALQPVLIAEGTAQAKPQAEHSYFITDTFRRVIFPDRDLGLYCARSERRKTLAAVLTLAALLSGVALLAWEGMLFYSHRQWLADTASGLQALGARNPSGSEALEFLREHLTQWEKYQHDSAPLGLTAVFYPSGNLRPALLTAYRQQWQTQVLEPIGRDLQARLHALSGFSREGLQAKSGGTIRQAARPLPVSVTARQGLQDTNPPLPPVAWPQGLASMAGDSPDAVLLGCQHAAGAPHDALWETAPSAGQVPALTEGSPAQADGHSLLAALSETYNRLKLYLILSQPQAYSDDGFVAEALPCAWLQAIPAQILSLGPEHLRAHVAFYLEDLRHGQARALPPNKPLVAQVRSLLKSLRHSSSLAEREYLRLQLESARQFPALTLDDWVPLPGRQQLYSGQSIPALYSKKVWEQFLMPELIQLLSAPLQDETDWVLHEQSDSGVVRKADFMREFMARYKSDYADAWLRFLLGTGVRRADDLEDITQQLTLLSDVQQSPLKTLLAAVNDNTRWDAPERHINSSATAAGEQGFWQRVRGVLGSDEAAVTQAPAITLPAIDDGRLAAHFEAVSRLFAAENAEGSDSTIMDRYLGNLRGLKVRLNNIQRSQDVGKASKALIAETLEGRASEIGRVRNYVDTSIDTSQEALSRALRALFITPVQSAWGSLRTPAGQQIARAWDKQIARPWQRTLGQRYPIVADSDNEASVKDLQRFVDPHSGLLPAFRSNEIGSLAGSEGLGLGSAVAQAPLVSPRLLSSIERAASLGEVIASLSDPDNGFEVMLEPAAGITDIVFTLDGQVSHYRNGRSSWSRFVWPGTAATPGARLDVVTVSGQRHTVFDYRGRWGLLKMSDSALHVTDVDEVQQRFSWTLGSEQVNLLVRNFGGVKLTDLAKVKSLGGVGKAMTATAKNLSEVKSSIR